MIITCFKYFQSLYPQIYHKFITSITSIVRSILNLSKFNILIKIIKLKRNSIYIKPLFQSIFAKKKINSYFEYIIMSSQNL